jgi:hypothetical protein
MRRDNDHIAATAKMAVLIVAAFPSRLSRYTDFALLGCDAHSTLHQAGRAWRQVEAVAS